MLKLLGLILNYRNDFKLDNDLIDKIFSQNLNINIYINSSLNLELEGAIVVEDIDEAITYINYNSSKYSLLFLLKIM